MPIRPGQLYKIQHKNYSDDNPVENLITPCAAVSSASQMRSGTRRAVPLGASHMQLLHFC
jgi:hypothetical protein